MWLALVLVLLLLVVVDGETVTEYIYDFDIVLYLVYWQSTCFIFANTNIILFTYKIESCITEQITCANTNLDRNAYKNNIINRYALSCVAIIIIHVTNMEELLNEFLFQIRNYLNLHCCCHYYCIIKYVVMCSQCFNIFNIIRFMNADCHTSNLPCISSSNESNVEFIVLSVINIVTCNINS